ncbi:DUF86 domain-containing protein [Candidatus Thorarchaeota archaeon]|nr:MAG: DUF86 domain-containing protein [Candidatus Thorarchaeota archaeon]
MHTLFGTRFISIGYPSRNTLINMDCVAMDQIRKTRYKTKMRYVIDSFLLAENLIHNPDEIEERALYYCLFTAIESTMDLIAMLIKDKGNIPMGDEYNIEYLVKDGIASAELALHLKSCNCLRNVLVH